MNNFSCSPRKQAQAAVMVSVAQAGGAHAVVEPDSVERFVGCRREIIHRYAWVLLPAQYQNTRLEEMKTDATYVHQGGVTGLFLHEEWSVKHDKRCTAELLSLHKKSARRRLIIDQFWSSLHSVLVVPVLMKEVFVL